VAEEFFDHVKRQEDLRKSVPSGDA